jgi:hypothetical protein
MEQKYKEENSYNVVEEYIKEENSYNVVEEYIKEENSYNVVEEYIKEERYQKNTFRTTQSSLYLSIENKSSTRYKKWSTQRMW